MSRFGMHSYCIKFQYTEPYTKCTLSNLPTGITSTASHSSTTVSPSKNANTSKRELMNQLEKVGIQVYIHNMNFVSTGIKEISMSQLQQPPHESRLLPEADPTFVANLKAKMVRNPWSSLYIYKVLPYFVISNVCT